MTQQEQAWELVREALGEVLWARDFVFAPFVDYVEEVLGPRAFAPENTAARYEFFRRRARTAQLCVNVQSALRRAARYLTDALELSRDPQQVEAD